MSKKALKLVGQRPMLLAFVIMATLTLGLLFSGWFTPTPGRAQSGGGDPSPNVESCTNCTREGYVSLNAPTNTPAGCVGSSFSVSCPGVVLYPADVTVITTNSDGSTTTTDTYPNPTYGVTWTASVGSCFSTNGTGLTAAFKPTCGGCGVVNFTLSYTNQSPCNSTGSSSNSGSFFVAQLTTNCTSIPPAMGVSSTNFNFCIGSGGTLSVTNNNVTNAVWVTTNWPSCPGCTNVNANGPTNYVSPVIVSNWWAVNGPGNYSTNGPGLSATFNPTNCGSGTVIFNETYKNNTPCDPTNVYAATPVSLSFTVDAVTSLTPSAGVLAPNTTNIWLVQYGCNSNIIVTAGDCLGLSPSDLPSCWTVTKLSNATQIDKMHFSIDGNTAVASTITITCGSSSQTVTVIVYKAQFRLKVMRGHIHMTNSFPPFDISFGHSWWELSLDPTDARSIFLKKYPQYYYYLNEGGFWPAGWSPLPIAGFSTGPGEVRIGGQEPVVDSEYDWNIGWNSLVSAAATVDYWYNHPPEFDLYNQNCTVVAILVANSVVGGIPSYTLPADLADWLNFLNWLDQQH